MKNTKQLGIWMDHSSAHLMEQINGEIVTTVLDSEFTHQIKGQLLAKGEELMHNKEQQQQSKFYNKLKDTIKNFDAVVLFGPTTAKSELANLLKDDPHFEKINIVVKNADKMNQNQMNVFVGEHFNS